MTLKEFKESIKSIQQLNKKIENYITYFDDKCYLNYEKQYREKYDFQIAAYELNDLVTDIKCKYIFIEDQILIKIALHKAGKANEAKIK